jgi:D-3-phosphoglycerate dehydrogenase
MGNIAVEVAKRAAVFGMDISAYRREFQSSPFAEVKASLEDAVRDADYISIHLPWTKETEKIFNEKIINSCRKRPVVINTGRAQCVDAEAVTKALIDGRIAYYATDVWPGDPPPPDYPILKTPNTLMIPHLGASSSENLMRAVDETVSILDSLQTEGKL